MENNDWNLHELINELMRLSAANAPESSELIEEKRAEIHNMLLQSMQKGQALYESNVAAGEIIQNAHKDVLNWEKRANFKTLADYLDSDGSGRVCVLYGLRRTGKTTMMRQAISSMPQEKLAKTAYIKATVKDDMGVMNRDFKKLFSLGYKYIFVDEVTLMEDFIDSAALFSDVFAAQGMKIVLSGADSLGFWFARDQELYDRAITIHTTYIPYREHSRLLKIDSVDEYIRYGGTLLAGDANFDDLDVNAQDAPFRDDESTRRYVDTAISRNIQNSLAFYEGGSHLRHLRELYKAGELTGAINRIIEDMTHSFLVEVLTKDFKSNDLGLAKRNIRKERDPALRTDILDFINKEAVVSRLMNTIEIRNLKHQLVGITPAHVEEIKEYLLALDLIFNCPIEKPLRGISHEYFIFIQPGMRYCQAQALVHSLLKDPLFSSLDDQQINYVTSRILEHVKGRMMEDIVLLETSRALSRRFRVFKLQFDSGEFDMVIYNTEKHCCDIYEIIHSDQLIPEQYKNLIDDDKLQQTERRFGLISGRHVLYRGPGCIEDNGISYENVERYLKNL
ncbi:MAG: AAA family ATPase [Clostridiales bacterium]|jgi:predicted AAA+ superfamily ATPase|nr:AAA family ATPase [Clostridiales bacterium]